MGYSNGEKLEHKVWNKIAYVLYQKCKIHRSIKITLLLKKVKSYAMPKLIRHRPCHQIHFSYKLLWYYGINYKQKSDEVNTLFNSVIVWTGISRIQGVIGRNSVNMGTVYAARPMSIARSPGAQTGRSGVKQIEETPGVLFW